MTAQVLETITIKDHELEFDGFPFDKYLETVNGGRKFPMIGTHCYRGYIGKYVLKGRQLYLSSFRARKSDGTWVDLEFFFPGQNEVPVTWNFAPIRVPVGDLIYSSRPSSPDRQFDQFQVDLFLHFESGILMDVKFKAHDSFGEVLKLVDEGEGINDSEKLSAWIDKLYEIKSPNGRLHSMPLNIMPTAEDAALMGVSDSDWKAGKDKGFIRLDIEMEEGSDHNLNSTDTKNEDLDWDEPF
jgi:hypothetical protein